MSSQGVSQEAEFTLTDDNVGSIAEVEADSSSDTSIDFGPEEKYSELFTISSLVDNKFTILRDEMEAARVAIEEAMKILRDIALGKYDLPPPKVVTPESNPSPPVDENPEIVLKSIKERQPTSIPRNFTEAMEALGLNNGITDEHYILPPSCIRKPKSRQKIRPSPISSNVRIPSATSVPRRTLSKAVADTTTNSNLNTKAAFSNNKTTNSKTTNNTTPIVLPEKRSSVHKLGSLDNKSSHPMVKRGSSSGKLDLHFTSKKVISFSLAKGNSKVELRAVLSKKLGDEDAVSKKNTGSNVAIDYGSQRNSKAKISPSTSTYHNSRPFK